MSKCLNIDTLEWAVCGTADLGSLDPWSLAWIGHNLWNMPGGIGALIGSLIGFMALYYVTHQGYKHVKEAQKHQAELERTAVVERLEWEQQCLAAGLNGELRAVRTHCEAQIDFLRESVPHFSAAIGQGKEYSVELSPFSQGAFYKSNAGNLGTLGADLAGEVTSIYEMLAYWQYDFDNLKKFTPETIVANLPKAAKNIENFMPAFTSAIRRLEAIEKGLPDPGTSYTRDNDGSE